MKFIKYSIIFVSILIVTILILLLGVIYDGPNNNNNNNVNNNYYNSNINVQNNFYEPIENTVHDIVIPTDYKLDYVTNRSDYFTISSLYEKYINEIANKNSAWLKNALSPNYMQSYNITDDNLFTKLTVPQKQAAIQEYITNIAEMLTTQIDNTTYIYLVKGTCRISETNTIFSVQVMFELDRVNKTYNIYPYQFIKDKGIDKLGEGDTLNNYTKEEIQNRSYNTFANYILKSDAEVAKEYFNNYSELLKYYQDEAYSKLNTEYAQKRFGSKAAFEAHLKANSNVLLNMEIDKYKVYSTQKYTDYMCTDKYDNLYIFRQENGIMRYTVFLDNYTVVTDSYQKEYNDLSKYDKGKYNLNKFINMVNTKDYAAIYNVLDTAFKNNNYKTQADLEKAIKNNMYSLNSLEIDDYDKDSYEYYVFECTIKNMQNAEQKRKMTIIINQTEGEDFTMSFSFE